MSRHEHENEHVREYDHDGCYCTREQLLDFLGAIDCDRDEEGEFHLTGSIASFMGSGDDFVIGPDAVYYADGQSMPLAAMYVSVTGRGAVKVIC